MKVFFYNLFIKTSFFSTFLYFLLIPCTLDIRAFHISYTDDNCLVWTMSLATLNVHDVTRDGGMAKGRDVDYQRIDPSMERNNNRIVAAAQQKRMCKKDP